MEEPMNVKLFIEEVLLGILLLFIYIIVSVYRRIKD